VTASDSCGATPSVACTHTQTQATCTATDASGNYASCHYACTSCINISLSDFNLFVLQNYSGGHDIQGKVAAGGNIYLSDFAVGSGLAEGDISKTLVAGGALSLTRGGVWGNASYGGGYSTNPSVAFVRGSASQSTPVNFAARGAQLGFLSTQLAALTTNGTTRRESWGGLYLQGTDPGVNVFQVDASAFTGVVLLSIDAPAGSLVVMNIHGASATLAGLGNSYSGGIDAHGVLFNFVDATTINARGYGFWGTVLAPKANIYFNNGSFDGGIYAQSFTGNAEGHIKPLTNRNICPSL
jgi:choice-of-anchor A domain-containing protein